MKYNKSAEACKHKLQASADQNVRTNYAEARIRK